ncbi:chitobiase/beta-hexosaminidase C-terminal domain-containing protein [Aestuariivivens insulae]|uniref:chitobiase/beta-hexosaminidase C-terminal domain-containing protein n=1 Tax=Aestuariivivens insulae TaxID=1621988 RepID=UPI001F586C2F|nr:chitobiase/beta-hexosaminidase C-terminal domain-containing protein [Aestuariivivens insulae]
MKLKVIPCLLAIIVFGCKKGSENLFLQQDQIQIVQPRLEATNQLIDSVAYLTASLKIDGSKIYYTTNGDDPTEQSKAYTAPIKILKPGVYKFRAYHPDWKKSDVVETTFYKSGLPIDTITWHTTASDRYKGVGAMTLNNNKKGTVDFKDNQWLGFDTIANATLYLKNKAYVKSLTIGYLSDPGSWIFPPKSVKIRTSVNGGPFKDKTIELQPLESITAPTLKHIDIPVNDTINQILVEVKNVTSIPQWHEGKGNKAWLFMDEWVLNY